MRTVLTLVLSLLVLHTGTSAEAAKKAAVTKGATRRVPSIPQYRASEPDPRLPRTTVRSPRFRSSGSLFPGLNIRKRPSRGYGAL